MGMLQRGVRSLVLGSLLLLAPIRAEPEQEGGVLVLNDENFDSTIQAHDNLLVEFYAPWCGHCKKLAPEYEQAAKELQKDGLFIAKIDASAHTEAAGVHGVRGFPTLKFFKNGTPIDYNGGRTSADIVTYVRKKSGPAAKPVDDVAAAKEFEKAGDAVVIGLFSDADSAGAKAFAEAADTMDDLNFAVSSNAEVLKEYGVDADTVIVIKSFDEGRADLKVAADTDVEAIKTFAASQSMRLVTPFSQETSKQIFGGPLKVHTLLFADESTDAGKAALEALNAVAKQRRGQFVHVIVPPSENRVSQYFGIEDFEVPSIMIADMNDGIKKYKFTGQVNEQEVLQYGQDFLDGKLQPHLKSEEKTDEDLAKPVKIVKGKTFEEIVLNNDKDVLVEFYAPWCGHCKSLEPKYDELAEKLSDVEHIVIAKMDATANEIDVEGVNVQGFPTIIFFSGTNKSKPIKYEAGREVKDFTEFLLEHSSKPFTLDGVDSRLAHDDSRLAHEEL